MSTDFYKAFEDRYRGSREDIKSRIKIYLPFILPLKSIYPNAVALDIGCGRGEWLELLKENSINAKGLDLNKEMVKTCQSLNLDAEYGDGIQYLQNEENEKYIAVTAFHVVEHISFEQLQTLVKEALRTLKPGGLLILETPNPENIRVSTESFYLDPTHSKPIPSSLLQFIPEFYGFYRSKIVKLQENSSLNKKEFISILDVLDGVSPDYAVIAQKSAKKETLKSLDEQFNINYGISLGDLTSKFESRIHTIEQKLHQTSQKAAELENKYNLIINSKSWKITKPLRIINAQLKSIKSEIKPFLSSFSAKNLKDTIKKYLISLKQYIASKPRLAKIVLFTLKPFPKLKNRLKNISTTPLKEESKNFYPTSINQLSPKAQKVYSDLKKEINSQKGSK